MMRRVRIIGSSTERRVEMTNSKNRMRHVRVSRAWILGFAFLAVGLAFGAPAPDLDRELTPDTALPIPPLKFDSAGKLVIEASATSSKHDFDYLVGERKLKNRKLRSRLAPGAS